MSAPPKPHECHCAAPCSCCWSFSSCQGFISVPCSCCRQCHSQGGARLLLLVIVAVFLVTVVLMFARDWGSPAADTSGSGWTVKLKIVITHLQAGAVPSFILPSFHVSDIP